MSNKYHDALVRHAAGARDAMTLLRSWCLQPLPRVPGMDTVIRLAWRIECGRTVEEAAAKEYVYRWHLAILPGDQVIGVSNLDPCVSIFGTPHPIGM